VVGADRGRWDVGIHSADVVGSAAETEATTTTTKIACPGGFGCGAAGSS
jgi:hypothetical protein